MKVRPLNRKCVICVTSGCIAYVQDFNHPPPPEENFVTFCLNEMQQHIVHQTNVYADQYIWSHELGPHSRVRQWTKRAHDVCELLRFLAITSKLNM